MHAQWDEARFKTEFSYPAIGEQDWLWHDKSKFPYDRVLAGKPGDTAAGRFIARTRGQRAALGQVLDPAGHEIERQPVALGDRPGFRAGHQGQAEVQRG